MKHNPAHHVEVQPRPAGIDRWAGMWVAVKHGEVVAAADTSLALVFEVRKLGPSGQGAVAQFVPEPSDVIVIGVG